MHRTLNSVHNNTLCESRNNVELEVIKMTIERSKTRNKQIKIQFISVFLLLPFVCSYAVLATNRALVVFRIDICLHWTQP